MRREAHQEGVSRHHQQEKQYTDGSLRACPRLTTVGHNPAEGERQNRNIGHAVIKGEKAKSEQRRNRERRGNAELRAPENQCPDDEAAQEKGVGQKV